MTEAEWFSDPPAIDEMLIWYAMGSERKLRLFFHTCCCRIEHALVDSRSKAVLNGVEQYIEGPSDRGKLLAFQSIAMEAHYAVVGTPDIDTFLHPTAAEEAAQAIVCLTNPNTGIAFESSPLISAAHHARRVLGGSVYYRTSNSDNETQTRMAAEAAVQAKFFRDIFGNPFRQVNFNPAWRTSDVLLLAQGIYADRAFDRMPILADALQDAGCDSEDILFHCRDTMQPHARGCWVVDLVLGKQ